MPAAAAGEEQGFFARGGSDFAGRGLIGDTLQVFCFGDTLELRGEAGGRMTIPAGRVERLRLDVGGSRSGTFYIARVFLSFEPEPLFLMCARSGGPGYAAPMRRFAAAVVAAKGLRALEHGGTRAGAIAAFGCTATVTVGTSIVALTVWARDRGMPSALAFVAVTVGTSIVALTVWARDRGMPSALAFVAAMVVLTGFIGWRFLYRDLPGPMRTFEEIEAYLPKQ